MAVVKELIRVEEDGTLSFGDYTLAKKTKVSDFNFMGDTYKVKTFKEITKLEKNDAFVYESVPGTAVHNMKTTEDVITFTVEGEEQAEFTLELEAEREYEVIIDGTNTGIMRTNLGGKLVISHEFEGKACHVMITKKD